MDLRSGDVFWKNVRPHTNVDAAVAVSFCGRQRSGFGGMGTTRATI